MHLMTPRHIAFELWCIHEDRKMSDKPVDGIELILKKLRKRHPYLSDELITQGLDLYLAHYFCVTLQSVTSYQRYFHSNGCVSKTW